MTEIKTEDAVLLPEQVPVDIAALADFKKTIEKAGEVSNEAQRLAVTFTKFFKHFSDAADNAVFLEDAVNDKARQILASHNVKAEDFVRFDLDKGVILVKGK